MLLTEYFSYTCNLISCQSTHSWASLILRQLWETWSRRFEAWEMNSGKYILAIALCESTSFMLGQFHVSQATYAVMLYSGWDPSVCVKRSQCHAVLCHLQLHLFYTLVYCFRHISAGFAQAQFPMTNIPPQVNLNVPYFILPDNFWVFLMTRQDLRTLKWTW